MSCQVVPNVMDQWDIIMLKDSIKGKNKLQPGTVWITGISASGKTTLSRSLYKRLKDDNYENVDCHCVD